MTFLTNEPIYCRFTGEALTIISCNGSVATVRDEAGDITGRIVGELTREAPRRRASIVEHVMFGSLR